MYTQILKKIPQGGGGMRDSTQIPQKITKIEACHVMCTCFRKLACNYNLPVCFATG